MMLGDNYNVLNLIFNDGIKNDGPPSPDITRLILLIGSNIDIKPKWLTNLLFFPLKRVTSRPSDPVIFADANALKAKT